MSFWNKRGLYSLVIKDSNKSFDTVGHYLGVEIQELKLIVFLKRAREKKLADMCNKANFLLQIKSRIFFLNWHLYLRFDMKNFYKRRLRLIFSNILNLKLPKSSK